MSRIPCQQSLPVAILFIFPLLAVLTLLPLYKLSEVLYKGNSAYVCVLFFTLPSIIFFTLIADQAWYPLLFISSVWLTVETTRRSNFLMAALLGISLYLEIFISFSLLPAAGFTVVWILVNWLVGSKQNRGRLFKQALLILLGFTGIYFLFRVFGGYDPWLRYQNAFINHRENKNFGGGVGEVFSFTFLNNLEFFYFIGFPPGILFLLSVAGGVRNFFRRTFTLPVLFSVSAGAVFVLLNVIGQTRGETARLWLFITPLIALVAGERLLRLPNWAQDAFVIVQLITVVFMFQFYYTL